MSQALDAFLHQERPVNWDDIKHFLAVARRRKLRRAGADLKVDQATVGRRISALEARLGAKLFERGAHGYELTEVGRRLLPSAERIEEEMKAVFASAGRLGGGVSGAVRVGAPIGVSSYLLAPPATALCAENPHLELQIVALPRTFNLSRREADLAIAVSKPGRGRLQSEKIGDYDLYLYATEAFLQNAKPIEKVEDLRRVAGIGYVSDLIFDPELDYAPLIDPEVRPHLTSSDLNVQLRCTLAGAGVCVLPEFMANAHPELQKVIPHLVRLRRAYWLVVHEDLVNVDRIKLVAERLKSEIRAALVAARSGSVD
ncbi:MAG: LysR family transcriptional regulator [Neomegalonema sp.]|nr:LysR family transcriptional regulator [Neomegalonema sp.]